ncbi:uncharacterized protein LOC131651218 [Vicia villosa]|uniref:uncharacterized protein LOC131651218 n=1 Tax=Vicia villosa TaxID=3911 RepID=UPI00273ABFE4|nr:uncharacterized protein LOC131651218 [Vicia villosa]
MGKEVKNMVLQILNQERDPLEFYQTFIVLIPKCKKPRTPKDFWPIRLCNVVMKLVTKTISIRVKRLLPEIIDVEQNTFVGGRVISNNVLVAMECFHWMKKKKKKGKKGSNGVFCWSVECYEVLGEYGFPDQKMYFFGVLPSSPQWPARPNVFLAEGYPSRRPSFPLLVCSLHRCPIGGAEEVGHGRHVTWDSGG